MLRKRNRLSSCDGIFNFDIGRDWVNINPNPTHPVKKFDEKEYTEYIDNFNCTFKNIKNDFEIEKELEDMMLYKDNWFDRSSSSSGDSSRDSIRNENKSNKEKERRKNMDEIDSLCSDLLLDFNAKN